MIKKTKVKGFRPKKNSDPHVQTLRTFGINERNIKNAKLIWEKLSAKAKETGKPINLVAKEYLKSLKNK
jgi:hypothetical protein